jgi:hypothetical protein
MKRGRLADEASGRRLRRVTGLTSRIGVPSIASRFATRTRLPSTARTRTRCSPIGLGRSGERVLKTPCSGRDGSLRGCVFSTSRRAWCSQVKTRNSSAGTSPASPGVTASSNTRTDSGAPSSPCRGAAERSTSGLATHPIGTTVNDETVTKVPPCA